MKLLFFGSEECDSCDKWLTAFKAEQFPSFVPGEKNTNIEFIYIDAFADEQQKFCDNHEVDEIPHIKVYDSNNRIIFNKIGFFHPKGLWKIFYSSVPIRKKAKAIFSGSRKVSAFNLSKNK